MKMCVLDGYALNPGDLSWGAVEVFGELTVHDRTPPELVAERANECEVVFTNKAIISADDIARLPELRYIEVLATGYNIVDVAAAAAHGVIVTNVPTYSTYSVAQLVFALVLELCHHTQAHSDLARGGEWARSPDFSFRRFPLIELSGKTMGIVGYGKIGRQTGRIAEAMGMNVLAAEGVRSRRSDGSGVKRVSLADLLLLSDVVSLHTPLTAETAGLIGRNALAAMKPTAFLINTSRGPLIVEQDLADALNAGQIAGAGLDVLCTEPPPPDNPLLTARNCIITPHIAWATLEARTRLLEAAIQNLAAFLSGAPINVVQ